MLQKGVQKMLTARPAPVGSDSSGANEEEEEGCGEDELPDYTNIIRGSIRCARGRGVGRVLVLLFGSCFMWIPGRNRRNGPVG